MKARGRGRPNAKYSQAVRLLGLYDRANRGEVLQASSNLADLLGIDKRTLQRDLLILREAGKLLPAKGPVPGWHLPQADRKWGMNLWSVLGVSLGIRAISSLVGPLIAAQVQPLLSQLRRSLAPGDQFNLDYLEQRVYVTEVGQKLYRDQPERMRDLAAMVEGLMQERPLDLLYLSPRRQAQGAEPRAMRVQNICLVLHRGGVYFVVDVLNDAGSRARRTLLALDRLAAVSVALDAASCPYPSDFRPDEYFRSAFGIWRGEEVHAIRLRIDPGYASAVRERTWHPTQRLDTQPDGSLIFTMQLGALEEVTDWVLGMGEHVCVEAPDALIDRVKQRLELALARYPRAPGGHAT